MRFGEIEELLDTRAQAHAEPLAAAEGDQRMRKLIPLAERIRPRIEEGTSRCSRYGAATSTAESAAGSMSARPKKSRQSRPR